MPTEQQPLKVTLYQPHVGQMTLHNSQARFRVLACGRRWGKTLACSNEMAKHALEHNDCVCMWVAPTYRQTMIAFRLMVKALRGVFASDPNKSEMRLELVNGSVIQFASAERYDNLRGEGVSFLVMDESAQIMEEAWTAALRPALSDTNGRAIFIGTPRGRNWFWNIFQLGLDPLEEEWESFTFPTAANPYIPAKEIASAKRSLPEETFLAEYEAEFLEESAGVFRNIDGCVMGGIEDPREGYTYVIGLDLAKYEDFTVVTVLNFENMHVDYWQRFNKIDWEDQLDIVAETAQRYNHALIEMDATGVGDPLVVSLQKRGVMVNAVKFNNIRKEQYVTNLRTMLQNKEITFPYLPVLIKELKMFSYHFTDLRNIVYGAPPGKHDDTITSLMLCAWKAQNRGVIPFETSTTVTQELASYPERELEDERMMQRQAQVKESLRFMLAHGIMPES